MFLLIHNIDNLIVRLADNISVLLAPEPLHAGLN